jgi:hypothetical protein
MTDLLPRPPTDTGVRPRVRRRRARRLSALQVIAVGLFAYVGAALLNADHLHDLATRQPYGWRRDVALMGAGALRWTSRTLWLDKPAHLFGSSPAPAHPATAAPRPAPPARGTTASGAHDSRIGADAPPSLAAPTTTTTSVPSTLRRAAVGAPLAVWVAGDSISQGVGTALDSLGAHDHLLVVTSAGRISTGLARPDYYDWPAAIQLMMTARPPEAIVLAFGANDAQDMQTDHGVVTFGSTAWDAEYRSRVAGVMDRARPGRPIVWIGLPVARDHDLDAKLAAIDRIYRDEATRHPGVLYVDTRALFSPDGTFQAYRSGPNGRQQLVRAGDGVHFTGAGYDVIAAAVQDRLTAAPSAVP